MNPLSPALFAASSDCRPCCPPPPEACACALLIPYSFGTTTPAANYAIALALVSDPLKVQCYGYQSNPSNPDTFTVTASLNSLELDYTKTPWAEFPMYGAVSVNSGDTINIVTSGTGGGSGGGDSSSVLVIIYDCDGAMVFLDESAPGPSGTFNYSVTTSGVYYVLVYFAGGVVSQPGFTHGNAVITATSMVANPVIALWDDSGTTRQLEACPKLYLPPLTESSGNWYADCATAIDVINEQTSSCVGYTDARSAQWSSFSFTATDGGTTLLLELSVGQLTGAYTGVGCYGSINAESGETIAIAWTFDTTAGTGSGTNSIIAFIYDDAGVLVESLGTGGGIGDSSSGTLTSSALPYTGRYTVICLGSSRFDVDSSGFTLDTTFDISSSGTLSVNPIQALYDSSLSCPSRLDCGDACP